LRAGILSAAGMLLGGYVGSRIALPMQARHLKAWFGCFLMLAAILLWKKTQELPATPAPEQNSGD
jgi:uncharacterized membrane protein YfcA